MAVRAFMTAEQFDALPEEECRKWELLDGELIEVPSATPEHNTILTMLIHLLDAFARKKKLGKLLPETDMAVRAESRLRPDLGYFSAEVWNNLDKRKVPVTLVPEIAIEIISPSESPRTINRKIDAYLRWGVTEVWLIYSPERELHVHTREGLQEYSEDAYLTTECVPGWKIQVAEIFDDL